jgi:hypothetical protein
MQIITAFYLCSYTYRSIQMHGSCKDVFERVLDVLTLLYIRSVQHLHKEGEGGGELEANVQISTQLTHLEV